MKYSASTREIDTSRAESRNRVDMHVIPEFTRVQRSSSFIYYALRRVLISALIMPARRPSRYRPITAATAAGAFTFVLPTVCCIRLFTRTGSYWPIVYTGIISSITFAFYGYDKMQARNLEWRVRETTLHFLGLIGGWPGALLGQHYFQHKTRKTAFQIPFWAIVVGWQYAWCLVWMGDQTVPETMSDLRPQPSPALRDTVVDKVTTWVAESSLQNLL